MAHALINALPETLIGSVLFGHGNGAFILNILKKC